MSRADTTYEHADPLAAHQVALTPVSGFVDAAVVGPDGRTVGTIVDIMLTVADGRVAYVVLSVGGVVGIGERLFAVPWSAFVVDPFDGQLSLDFDKAALDGLDGFDKDCWPTCPDTRLLHGN